MKARVWHDLEAALIHALMRLTHAQRRDLERRLDKSVARWRARTQRMHRLRQALGPVPVSPPGLPARTLAHAEALRHALGPMPVTEELAERAGYVTPKPENARTRWSQVRAENIERRQFWARVEQNARQGERRVSHFQWEG